MFCRNQFDEASQLTYLGFFIPETIRKANSSYPSVKCSFCRKMFTYGPSSSEFVKESSIECRISMLYQRHLLSCSTCPTSIGLKGDNRSQEHRDKTPVQLALTTNTPFSSTLSYPPHCHTGNTEVIILEGTSDFQSQLIRESLNAKYNVANQNFSTEPPEIDDETYFHFRAEIEEEAGAEFQPEDIWPDNLEKKDFNSPLEIIDLFIGESPANPNMLQWISRIKSFEDKKWSKNTKITTPSVDQLAQAGFYYTGIRDSVRCFWCDLSLESWKSTDDAWYEHTRFLCDRNGQNGTINPLCSWVFRCKGPFYVRKVLKDSIARPPFEIDPVYSAILQFDELQGM